MSFSALYVNQEIEALTPYKYLDSLDTVRFRDFAFAQVNGAQLHAYADFFLSLLMGEGILVAGNQLIDSLAFLDVASQLILHARKTNRLHLLNLRAALFKTNDPYEAAAASFGKVGTEEKQHADRFLLSGWPRLDTDYPRRKKWQEQLGLRQPIPTTSEFCHPDEQVFVEKLNVVLDYFSTDGKSQVRPAGVTTQVRIDEIHQVADLSQAQKEELLSDLDGRTSRILLDAIDVIDKLRRNVEKIDMRSEILNALVLPGTPSQLNPFYFEKTSYPDEAHKGVLSIVDSIYNYAAGVGVRADLIGHTARASMQDRETPSFYALALWTRLTNKREKNFVLNTPNGLIVPSGIQWNRLLAHREIMERIARQSFAWDVIFEATADPDWRRSLDEYLKALRAYHTSDAAGIREKEQRYLEARLRHLDRSRRKIPKKVLDIRETEVRIELEGLKKEIEETVTSTEETGQETSRSAREEAAAKSSSEAKFGAELSLTPKLSGEISSALETAITIANERQEKQTRLVQQQRSRKASGDVVFRLEKVKTFYETEKSNAVAIKGIIAAIEESLV